MRVGASVPIRKKAKNGTDGVDGYTYESVAESFGNSASSTSANITTSPAGATWGVAPANGMYRWRRYRTKKYNSKETVYLPSASGYYYECVGYTGTNGMTKYTWVRYSDGPLESDGKPNELDLYDTPTDYTKFIGFAFNKDTEIESNNAKDYTWKEFVGRDGKGIVNANVFYASTTSSATPADSAFTKDTIAQVDLISGRYIHQATKISYTDNTHIFTGKICLGKAEDFSSIEEVYCVHTSGSNAPTANATNFKATYTPVKGKWLWAASKVTGHTSSGAASTWYIGVHCVLQFPVDGETIHGDDGMGFSFNLLDGTRNWSGTWSGSGFLTTGEKYQGLDVMQHNRQWGGPRKAYENCNAGETYTFSCWLKTEGDAVAQLWVSGTVNGVSATRIASKTSLTASEWTRVSVTFTLPEGCTQFTAYCERSNTEGTAYMCGYKLEPGDKATDWAPSINDMYGRGIVDTITEWGISANHTTQPSVWYTSPSNAITTDENPVLWNRITTYYSDGTQESTVAPIGIKARDGVGSYQLDLSNEMDCIGILQDEGGDYRIPEIDGSFNNSVSTDVYIAGGNGEAFFVGMPDVEILGDDSKIDVITTQPVRSGGVIKYYVVEIFFKTGVVYSPGDKFVFQIRATAKANAEATTTMTLGKDMNVLTLIQGKDGLSPIIYQLLPPSDSIVCKADGTVLGTYDTCKVVATVGNSRTVYNANALPDGRLVIKRKINNLAEESRPANSANWRPPVPGLKIISLVWLLYYDGTLIDREDIPVLEDGEPGGTGPRGEGAWDASADTLVIPVDEHGTANLNARASFTGWYGAQEATVYELELVNAPSRNTEGYEASIYNTTKVGLSYMSYDYYNSDGTKNTTATSTPTNGTKFPRVLQGSFKVKVKMLTTVDGEVKYGSRIKNVLFVVNGSSYFGGIEAWVNGTKTTLGALTATTDGLRTDLNTVTNTVSGHTTEIQRITPIEQRVTAVEQDATRIGLRVSAVEDSYTNPNLLPFTAAFDGLTTVDNGNGGFRAAIYGMSYVGTSLTTGLKVNNYELKAALWTCLNTTYWTNYHSQYPSTFDWLKSADWWQPLPDEWYTLSFFAKAAVQTCILPQLSDGVVDKVMYNNTEQSATNLGMISTLIPGNGTWKRYSVTFHVKSSYNSTCDVIFRLTDLRNLARPSISICGIKLEHGKQATPYCSAEGTASAYQQVTSLIENTIKRDPVTNRLIGVVKVETGQFIVDSENFSLDEDGNVKVTGEVNATSGTFDGVTSNNMTCNDMECNRGTFSEIEAEDSKLTNCEVVGGTLKNSSGNWSINMDLSNSTFDITGPQAVNADYVDTYGSGAIKNLGEIPTAAGIAGYNLAYKYINLAAAILTSTNGEGVGCISPMIEMKWPYNYSSASKNALWGAGRDVPLERILRLSPHGGLAVYDRYQRRTGHTYENKVLLQIDMDADPIFGKFMASGNATDLPNGKKVLIGQVYVSKDIDSDGGSVLKVKRRYVSGDDFY